MNLPVALDIPGLRGHRPVIWSLVTVMVGVYVAILLAHPPYEDAIRFGVVPLRPDPASLIAALFLHATGFHLLLNVAMLVGFGLAVESALGSTPFLILYLIGGLGANLAQIGGVRLFLPGSEDLPIVGASGAVSTVVGAFAGLFPHACVRLRSSSRRRRSRLPMVWLWGSWLGVQLVGIALNLMGLHGDIGYWGHGAGFALGLAAVSAMSSVGLVHPTWAEERPAKPLGGETEPESRLLRRAVQLATHDQTAAAAAADRAAGIALGQRSAEEVLAIYRWLENRRWIDRLSPERRLEMALLLENESRPNEALALLQPLVQHAPTESAAEALLTCVRLFRGPLGDAHRAQHALELLDRRFHRTRAAALARACDPALRSTGNGRA